MRCEETDVQRQLNEKQREGKFIFYPPLRVQNVDRGKKKVSETCVFIRFEMKLCSYSLLQYRQAWVIYCSLSLNILHLAQFVKCTFIPSKYLFLFSTIRSNRYSSMIVCLRFLLSIFELNHILCTNGNIYRWIHWIRIWWKSNSCINSEKSSLQSIMILSIDGHLFEVQMLSPDKQGQWPIKA